MRWRTVGRSAAASDSPSKITDPVSGANRPIISRISVDLPQPLGPMSTVVAA